jgi:hypothetical protein
MAFTKSQIASIEQLARKLKKWADEQPYSPPSSTVVQVSLSWVYKDEILWLLAEIPGLGVKVERDFAELDEQVHAYEGWRGREITEDNELDFRIAVEGLRGTLYDLADTLRRGIWGHHTQFVRVHGMLRKNIFEAVILE